MAFPLLPALNTDILAGASTQILQPSDGKGKKKYSISSAHRTNASRHLTADFFSC